MRPQRVDRLLSNLGYCTRGGALSFIKKNQVLVEGERVLSLHAKALPSQVTINGEAIRSNEPLVLLCAFFAFIYCCSLTCRYPQPSPDVPQTKRRGVHSCERRAPNRLRFF
ncbi:hypothetical protein QOT17_015333, partial [Balamuthia mandrillaris]